MSPSPPPSLPSAEELHDRGLELWYPPEAWRAIEGGPPALVVAGRMPTRPGVAVVGSRATDAYGLACARRVAGDAVRLGRSVISGGAEGCDAGAHRAALEAGGHTVVVLGSGHDHVYPARHRPLFHEVLERGGAVVSPWAPEVRPARWRFLQRNSVIAWLSAAVVVTRAAVRSGALSTARAARELGRPVLAVPSDVGEGRGEGPNELLARGHALALTGPAALARALGEPAGGPGLWPSLWAGTADPWPEAAGPLPCEGESAMAGTPAAQALLTALEGGRSVDLGTLSGQTQLPIPELTAALVDLEVLGVVESLAGARYRRVRGM